MKIRFAKDVQWPQGKGPGWKPGPDGVAIENEKFRHQIVHVAVCKDDGTPIYDQILHYEAGGAITLPVNSEGKIGLVEIERPVQREAAPYALVGRNAADDEAFLRNLGRKVLEAPRGMAKKNEEPGQVAAREGEEEIGSAVRRVTYLGPIADNTTFKPTMLHAYLAEVDETQASKLPPDVNEKIFQVKWFGVMEVLRMLKMGRDCPIACAFTKAVLAHYVAVKFAPPIR